MTAPNRDDQLQQYFDGELPPDEADALERQLEAGDDDAAELRAKLEGLSHLHTLVEAHADALASELDSEALFSAIRAKIDAGVEDDAPMFPGEMLPGEALPAAAEERPALRVLDGGAGAEKKQAPAEAPAEDTSDRGNVIWISFGVVAAAAAVLFFVLRGGGSPGVDPTVEPAPEAPLAQADPPPGSEIEEVDFGYSTGAIFTVEGSEGEQYAVVWISDEKIDTDPAALPPEPEERIQ